MSLLPFILHCFRYMMLLQQLQLLYKSFVKLIFANRLVVICLFFISKLLNVLCSILFFSISIVVRRLLPFDPIVIFFFFFNNMIWHIIFCSWKTTSTWLHFASLWFHIYIILSQIRCLIKYSFLLVYNCGGFSSSSLGHLCALSRSLALPTKFWLQGNHIQSDFSL